MKTTVNGSLTCSSPFNPTAAKLGKTFACCLILVVSLLGNSFIGILVYKTHTLRKPINFFIVNMAMSDLLFAILLFPRELTYLYADSWLISGPVGQALCKLVPFLADVSFGVSIQSLVMMAVDQVWSCPISSPFPSHQFKAVPLLHSRHVDHRNGSIFAIFSRLQTCCVPRTTPLLVAVE